MIAKSALAFACAVACVSAAAAASSHRLEVPAQSLATALNELARQSGVQIIYFSEIADDLVAPALIGAYTVQQALSTLLDKTGLKFVIVDDATVFIEIADRNAPATSGSRRQAAAANRRAATVPAPETVIVTARRREESVMEVPASIDVLTRNDLEGKNIENLLLANGQFNNVSIRTDPFNGAAGVQISMRGVAGAVLYQDGVPVKFGALPAMIDIERVEVMQGPQGTLFGRNAIGGAIQTVTQKPEQTLFSVVEVAGGSLGRADVRGKVNVPLNSEIAASITAASLNRDAFVTSTATGDRFGSQEDRFVRLDGLWSPDPDTEVRLQYAQLRNKSNGQAYVNFRLESVCPGDPVPQGYFARSGRQVFSAPNAYCILSGLDLDGATPGSQPYAGEFQSYGQQEAYRNTIKSTDMAWWQDIHDVKLDLKTRLSERVTGRALFSRRWGTENSTEDLDGTGLDIFQNSLNEFQEKSDVRTAELQLVYESRRFSGITGLYWEYSPGAFQKRLSWLHNELTIPRLQAAAENAYPGSTSFRDHPESAPFNTAEFFRISKTSSEQWAAFSEWSYAVSAALKLNAGIRFTRQSDRRVRYLPGAQGAARMPPVRCCNLEQGVDYLAPAGPAESIKLPVYTQWTPRFSMQYSWNAGLMTYLSYAEGGSAGGLDVNAPPGTPNRSYRPQTIRSVEGGLRTQTDSGQTDLRLAAFYTNFDDVQITEEIFPGTLMTGNAQARIYGLEVEGSQRFARWELNYGLGWLTAEYTDVGTTSNLLKSSPFAYAPELNLSIGGVYRRNVGRYELSAQLDHTWQGSTVTSADPILAEPVPSRGLLSTRLEIAPVDGLWKLALSGTNLGNEFYITNGFLLPADQSFVGTMGRPREWALTLSMRFQ